MTKSLVKIIKIERKNNKINPYQKIKLRELATLTIQKMLYEMGANTLEITRTAQNAPKCRDNRFYCSWSYSGEYISCITSLSPIGIDIEKNKTRTYWKKLSQYLWEDDKPKNLQEYYRKWCITEAWSKILGSGLNSESWKLKIENNIITHANHKNKKWIHKTYYSDEFTISIVQEISSPLLIKYSQIHLAVKNQETIKSWIQHISA